MSFAGSDVEWRISPASHVQELVGAGFFDPAIQPGIPNSFSIGIGLHGSKQKFALPCEATWRWLLRVNTARGCFDGQYGFGDHFKEDPDNLSYLSAGSLERIC